MATYGYIRVSTDKQELENQKHEILNYSNNKKLGNVEFIEETISTRIALEKRKIWDLLTLLHNGDTLIVSELSRLGRSTMEVMTIFKYLAEKDISTHIIKGNFIIGDPENKIQSTVLIFAFSLAAEIERELISSRTKEALKRKKAEGVVLGRPKGSIAKSKLDGKEKEIEIFLEKNIPVASIAKILNCSRTTLVQFIKSRKLKVA